MRSGFTGELVCIHAQQNFVWQNFVSRILSSKICPAKLCLPACELATVAKQRQTSMSGKKF